MQVPAATPQFATGVSLDPADPDAAAATRAAEAAISLLKASAGFAMYSDAGHARSGLRNLADHDLAAMSGAAVAASARLNAALSGMCTFSVPACRSVSSASYVMNSTPDPSCPRNVVMNRLSL